MRITIEDYFGNDVITLKYEQFNPAKSIKGLLLAIRTFADIVGYDVADIDEDDDGVEYVRLQEVNVDNSEVEGVRNLTNLLDMLNKHMLS